MKCSKARQLIPRYVDSELSEGMVGEVQAHLAACGECRAEERSLRRALDLLGEWPDVPAAGQFEGVMRRVEQPATWRAFRLPLPRWAVAALAAISLAGGAAVGLRIDHAPPTKPPSEVRVAAAMDLNSFAVNDMLEASIQKGMTSGQDVPGKAVE
jgi:anti-sigma factor RsiW